VKKLIIAINGIFLLAGLLIFTSFVAPTTASASVMPQNSNTMTMTGSSHHRRRHHRRRHHHRRHHHNSMKNSNM
jgi:hypothetical protein